MELEKRGVRAVVVGTDRFKRLGEIERRSLGMPELTMAIAEHLLAWLPAAEPRAESNGRPEQGVRGGEGGHSWGREAWA